MAHHRCATATAWSPPLWTGAPRLSARVPMQDGSVREALLGCATPSDYLHQDAYLGATIGRYANRIAFAELKPLNRLLAANQGPHQLHGGPQGFDKRRWQILSQSDSEVHYRLDSPDGDRPGNLIADVITSSMTITACRFAMKRRPIRPVRST